MKALRVLIVDGRRNTADKLAQWVTCAGHQAKVCGSQIEQAAREYRPNVVLLDLDLPGVDSRGLAASLCSADSTLFVAASVGERSPTGEQSAEEFGIRLCVRKPVRRRTVLRLLESATNGERKMSVTVKETPSAIAMEGIRSQAVATHICSRFRQLNVDAKVCLSSEAGKYQVAVSGADIDAVERVLGELRIETRRE